MVDDTNIDISQAIQDEFATRAEMLNSAYGGEDYSVQSPAEDTTDFAPTVLSDPPLVTSMLAPTNSIDESQAGGGCCAHGSLDTSEHENFLRAELAQRLHRARQQDNLHQ